MTNDQLKAELAQLAAENQRLREGLEAVALHHDDAYCGQDLRDLAYMSKETLKTPPTPGLGAAMLRVVEAAVALMTSDDLSLKGQMHPLEMELDDAVQALNELEAKHEP